MIGAILKKIREKIGLTQIYVSEQLGVHRNEISMIETNKRRASVKKVQKMLDLYGKYEWHLTPTEQRALNNFLIGKPLDYNEDLKSFNKMDSADNILRKVGIEMRLSESDKVDFYDNMEHEAINWLIKKKYL